MGARQTRLRREYAAWYPTISVGTWIPASTVARAVMRQLLERESPKALCPRWEPGPRILDERHFKFRGGSAARDPAARSRREDREVADLHGPGRTAHDADACPPVDDLTQ